MSQGLSIAAGIVAAVIAIGAFCFGVIFVLAGMIDVTGGWLPALAILLLVAVAIAAIVLAAYRSQVAKGTVSKTGMLSDWARSFALVLGAVFFTLLSSFFVTGLLFSLAEHRLLPAAFGSALLEARRAFGPMSILGLVWVALQLGWIVPMALRINRDGMGRAVDAFRLAGSIGLYVSLLLSLMAQVAIFFLLDPPSR